MEGDYIMSLVWAPLSGNVFTEVTATIEFTDDDVRAVYIDWDDGASNKKSESNYQWEQLTEPKPSITPTHMYTASGTYNPVIQTMNSKGFFSKYMTSGGTPGEIGVNTEVSPSVADSGINTITIYDGQATGIMRVENKTVKSGIDNSIFEKQGPRDLYLMIPPLCTSGALNTINSITIEIEAVVASTMFTSVDSTTSAGSGRSVQTISTDLTDLPTESGAVGPLTIAGGQCSEVLKVTYKNPKYITAPLDYDANDAYKNLKIFVLVKDDNDNYQPVTYVSAGCPIKKSNDPLRNITMDFSQSRAKASNISISSYRYDNGKMWFNPVDQWAVSGSIFGDQTEQTGELKPVSYTYSNVRPDGIGGTGTIDSISSLAFDPSTTMSFWAQNSSVESQLYRTDQFIIDEFGKFTDQYHMLRMSADPDTVDKDGTGNVSSIADNKPYVFRMTPAATWGADDVSRKSAPTKLDYSDAGVNFTAEYTDEAFANASGNMVSLSGMNTQTFEYVGGTERTANEYLLLLFESKTNKLFFNMNNYANELMTTNLNGGSFTSPWKISGISYLALENSGTAKQNAYWKSVEFDDTTKVSMEYIDTGSDTYIEQSTSLSQSGYLSFDMPLDWSATTMKQLCGGALAPSAEWDEEGFADITLTGSCGTSATVTGYGKQNPVTLNAASISGMAGLTADEVGSFKYGFIITDDGGGAGDKRFYWVGSGASNGWDGTNKLNLHYGDDTNATEPAGTITGSLRRVNIYDIVNGYSKFFRGDSNAELVPVDATGAWDNEYMIKTTGSGVGGDLLTAWKSNELYALKISLSGAAGTLHDGRDTERAYPELWNIFDATTAYTTIVKEIDDSAYNLNALPVTSDISISRGGTYYSAITRKGKVFIARTGDTIENISFTSVALGDETFATFSADSSMYGQLRKIRKLHANTNRVYWDEPQKDGTFVRYWGVITKIDETHGTGGPRSVITYNFNVMLEDIALIDVNGNLMTDLFPLGGISDGRDYS